MKTILSSLLCFLLLAGATAQDNKYVWPVKLQKDYTKSFPVNTETIALLNRYGKMSIETWDKNEVKVDAHISVGASTNEYATQVLDKITIKDDKQADKIVFSTEIGDWISDNNGGGREMSIDFTVHLPANAKLYAENHYGPITIGDFKGESEIHCKYGTLTAGKLINCKSATVEYGKAVIESISDSKLYFRSSKVDISKLAGSITGQFEYCTSVDIPVDNSVKQLDLKNNYTSVYLVVPNDFAADYDVQTNNARFSGKADMKLKEEENKNTTGSTNTNRAGVYLSNHHYTGSLGKGGGTQISIKSNYGNVRVI